MALFRRSDPSRERTAADRERARLEREARRRGVSLEELLAEAEGSSRSAAAAPQAPAVEEHPVADPVAAEEPQVVEERVLVEEPVAEDPPSAPVDPDALTWSDPAAPDDDLTWTEPARGEPAQAAVTEPGPDASVATGEAGKDQARDPAVAGDAASAAPASDREPGADAAPEDEPDRPGETPPPAGPDAADERHAAEPAGADNRAHAGASAAEPLGTDVAERRGADPHERRGANFAESAAASEHAGADTGDSIGVNAAEPDGTDTGERRGANFAEAAGAAASEHAVDATGANAAEPPASETTEPPAVDATAAHRLDDDAALPGDLPPRELDPPPLPARSSARPLPRAPQRRYRQADARRSPAQGPIKRRRSWAARIAAIVVIALAAVVIWFLFSLFQPGKGDGHGTVAVTIPQGASARDIGDQLADQGVVASGFFFNLRATISGKRDDFKAGRFTLHEDMSYGAAIDTLTKPRTVAAVPTVKLTIPEGLSRREIAPRAKQAGIKGSYLAASDRHRGFSPRRYGAPRGTRTLEGFLFPATYELRASQATANRLVGQQLEAFQQNFSKVSMRAAKRKNLTPYDVLIIASMIEREAQVAKERRIIAAVIYNRLRDQMPLGIDATTRFELGEWSRPLRVSELQRDTPYNTRTRRGLPPTPIGNPGLASIQAAANPAKVDYLYYVVKPGTCGEHSFSATDAEFQQDVAAYEAARAKNGGKSPTTC